MPARPMFRQWRKSALESQDLIGGSFSLSGVLERSSSLSGRNNRDSLCLMEFHREWQHKTCPVMKWYELQRAFCTRFRSIQHRRNKNAPLYHEFLLLQLVDGSFYRIERMGAGSTVNAIRNIGCTANDYIQHFSADDHKSFACSDQSELIAEVSFSHEFDLMDALAICYAVYMRRHTRSYTLQRFNCYFLCNAIILVLERLLVRWEADFTFEVWRNALHGSLGHLENIARDDEKGHLVLEVCRLLDPKARVPAHFIYDALRCELDDESDAYNSLKLALASTLWRSSWSECRKYALTKHVNKAVEIALKGQSIGARSLKAATVNKSGLKKFEFYNTINRITDKKATLALSDGLNGLLKATGEQYRMEKIERPHTVMRSAWITVASHTMGLLFPLQLLFQGDMEEWGFKHIFIGSWRGICIAQSTGVFMCRRLIGISPALEGQPIRVKGMQLDTTSTSTPLVVRANYEMAAQTLRETLAELRVKSLLSVPNITIALHGVLCKNIWDVWLNQAVGDLLHTALPDLPMEKERVIVKIPNADSAFAEDGSLDKTCSFDVLQCQEFVSQRIEAHAKRIEDCHLAAALLVSRDIRNAIADVWMSMPPGSTDNVHKS